MKYIGVHKSGDRLRQLVGPYLSGPEHKETDPAERADW